MVNAAEDALAALKTTNAVELASQASWGADDKTTWYVVPASDVTINDRITVRGDVNLILTDEATLAASKDIGLEEGSSLTIYGQSKGNGTLTATVTDSDNTAIGGDSYIIDQKRDRGRRHPPRRLPHQCRD